MKPKSEAIAIVKLDFEGFKLTCKETILNDKE